MKNIYILLIMLFIILSVLGCSSSADEACKPIKITSCAKFVDGRLVDFYTIEGKSCRSCRGGYVRSCDGGCE